MAKKSPPKKLHSVKKLFQILGLILIVFVAYLYINIRQVEKRGEKIVFVEEGNIKIADIDGSNLESLTERKFEQLQNAKRTFCPEVSGGECRSEDVSRSYFNRYFGEVMGISPNGRYLAATSYNKSIKDSIESNDKKLHNKYLTGSYWNPHYQTINIFDLKNKKLIKTIDMEEKTGEYLAYIQRIIWSPKDTDLTIFSMSGNYKINIKTESVSKVSNVLSTYQNTFAYIPGMRSIYFTDHWGLYFQIDTKIYQTYVGHKIESPKEIIKLVGEKLLIDPQDGLDDNMFFATFIGDEIKLYEYKPLNFKPLKLVRSWKPKLKVSTDSDRYSDVYIWSTNPISPNGKFVRLFEGSSNRYYFYNVETGMENTDLKQLWEDGDLKKWRLDENKVMYCQDKKLFEYSISDSSKKEVLIFKENCPESLHINYIN